ncbi:hypothetical protein D9M68_502800 [compost metagenome]
MLVDLGVDHVRGHHGRQDGVAQPRVRRSVFLQNAFQRTLVHGNLVVRIRLHEAVAREVLAASRHAGELQALDERARQHGDHAGIAVESAVADDLADAVVQIQHGREAHVHAAGPQFGRQHVPGLGRQAHRQERIAFPQRTQFAHRGQRGEAVFAEALHAAAFVVHQDQQRLLAGLVDLARQLGELFAAFEVAGEQNHAAHERMAQALFLFLSQRVSRHIDHHGARRQGRPGFLLGHVRLSFYLSLASRRRTLGSGPAAQGLRSTTT